MRVYYRVQCGPFLPFSVRRHSLGRGLWVWPTGRLFKGLSGNVLDRSGTCTHTLTGCFGTGTGKLYCQVCHLGRVGYLGHEILPQVGYLGLVINLGQV